MNGRNTFRVTRRLMQRKKNLVVSLGTSHWHPRANGRYCKRCIRYMTSARCQERPDCYNFTTTDNRKRSTRYSTLCAESNCFATYADTGNGSLDRPPGILSVDRRTFNNCKKSSWFGFAVFKGKPKVFSLLQLTHPVNVLSAGFS